MLSKILVAYGGSEPADKAFAFGLDFAQKYGAELHVLVSGSKPCDWNIWCWITTACSRATAAVIAVPDIVTAFELLLDPPIFDRHHAVLR